MKTMQRGAVMFLMALAVAMLCGCASIPEWATGKAAMLGYGAVAGAGASKGVDYLMSPGETVTETVDIGGTPFPFALPAGAVNKGRDEIHNYIAKHYPQFSGYTSTIADQFLGKRGTAPKVLTLPLMETSKLTIELKGDSAGKYISEDEISLIVCKTITYVTINTNVIVVGEVPTVYSPGEYKTRLTNPDADPVEPATPDTPATPDVRPPFDGI